MSIFATDFAVLQISFTGSLPVALDLQILGIFSKTSYLFKQDYAESGKK